MLPWYHHLQLMEPSRAIFQMRSRLSKELLKEDVEQGKLTEVTLARNFAASQASQIGNLLTGANVQKLRPK
jgi:hypothetical protein